jgi:hypothetical protein
MVGMIIQRKEEQHRRESGNIYTHTLFQSRIRGSHTYDGDSHIDLPTVLYSTNRKLMNECTRSAEK